MSAAIDFRIRPPIPALLSSKMYSETERTCALNRTLGFHPADSFLGLSLEKLLEEMDGAEIQLGVVPVRAGAGQMGDCTNADVRLLLDRHQDRFIGFAGSASSLPPDEQIHELAEALADPGFKGVVIEPGYQSPPVHLDDETLWPVLRECTRRAWPIMLLAGGNAGPDLSYTDPARLDRLLCTFPECRFIATHGGWPWVSQILHLALRRQNLWVSPDMYLYGMPGTRDYVDAANGFLRDRFLFASSYPFTPADEARWALERLGFSTRALQAVLYDNAARLLDL